MARKPGSKNKLKVDKLLENVPNLDKVLDVARVGMSESMVILMEAMNGVGPYGDATLELRFKAAKEVNTICRDLFRAELEKIKQQALDEGYTEEELESEEFTENPNAKAEGNVVGFIQRFQEK